MDKMKILAMVTPKGELPDQLFKIILEATDPVEKVKITQAIKDKAKEVNRLKEFRDLLSAWATKYAQQLRQNGNNSTNFTDAPISLKCKEYRADDTGIRYTVINKMGEAKNIEVCPHPILPVERYVNIDTGMEKIKIAFFKDSKWREIVADCNTIYNKSYICSLADRGIIVTSESAKELVKYIADVVSSNMQEIPVHKSISRLGWVEETKFSPYCDVKYDGDSSYKDMFESVRAEGKYEEWRNCVKSAILYSKEVRLIIASSLASVLIEKVDTLPFITHLWGTTGGGKTVALMLGASVWGNPKSGKLTRTMDMTVNALSRMSSFLYNLPFFADELQTIRQEEGNYDKLIMKLTEGIDRGRAKAFGGVEELKTWRNCFVFTGEEPITKDDSGGGVKNRVIEIEITDKIIEDGNKTVSVITQNYGFAGKLFIEYINNTELYDLQKRYKTIFKNILNTTVTTEKQAMAMGVVLLADELMCESIFSEIESLQITDIKEYLKSVKSVDVGQRAYDWLCSWLAENRHHFKIESNQPSIFSSESNIAIWGAIRNEGTLAVISKNILVSELKKANFDYTQVSSLWAKMGYLIRTPQGKFVHQTKVSGIKAGYNFIVLPKEDIIQAEPVVDEDFLPF